eukprot:CAMPEP_0184872340 /NCGR_PEP_ID=MMETSP0580-20130426/41234_1 /TAXON_ID=1118495 /ORGANISM="Dactyliosolen fragilissimus" /LENGTH=500 /DNA_ID=CAMNT_0027375127 /DNA_START=474 /DNA_END=1976 /DNA_ORIENTATION=-
MEKTRDNMCVLPMSNHSHSHNNSHNPDDNSHFHHEDIRKISNSIRQQAIDMSPYCTTTPNAKQCHNDIDPKKTSSIICAKQLLDQLQQDGFALVKGTNISPTLCQSALQITKSFLHHAPESTRRSCLTRDRAKRGYSPSNTENFATLLGHKGVPNDLVRKFRIGPSTTIIPNPKQSNSPNDCTSTSTNASTSISTLKTANSIDNIQTGPTKSGSSPNIYPTTASWNDKEASAFQSILEQYFQECDHAANAIVRAICDGMVALDCKLEQPLRPLCSPTPQTQHHTNTNTNHNLTTNITNTTSILTLLGYRKGARHHGKCNRPLVAPHTDVGVITMLLFDDGDHSCAILQRAAREKSNPNGVKDTNVDANTNTNTIDWVDVRLPICSTDNEPVFVINVGDCLSELCHGSLPSTLHRVMPMNDSQYKDNNNSHNHQTNACEREKNEKGSKKKNTNHLARTCLAMFVGPRPDVSFVFPHHNEPITFEEWRRKRIDRAMMVLRSE